MSDLPKDLADRARELAILVLNETGGYIEPWVKRSIPIIATALQRERDEAIERVKAEKIPGMIGYNLAIDDAIDAIRGD